jgi:hypothetical protein
MRRATQVANQIREFQRSFKLKETEMREKADLVKQDALKLARNVCAAIDGWSIVVTLVGGGGEPHSLCCAGPDIRAAQEPAATATGQQQAAAGRRRAGGS